MVNWAFAGSGIPMRKRPFLRSRLCAVASSRWTLGQLAPSTGAKSGSRPRVRMKVSLAAAEVNEKAWSGRWHVPQVRPFVPRDWKKALRRSISPILLSVSKNPVGSGNNSSRSGVGLTFDGASASDACANTVERLMMATLVNFTIPDSLGLHSCYENSACPTDSNFKLGHAVILRVIAETE